MGQARQRQEEIKCLKEQSTAPVSIDVLAYRHFDNNQQKECVYFSFEPNTCAKPSKLTQNDLLGYICRHRWVETSADGDRLTSDIITDAISVYLLNSKSYQFIKDTHSDHRDLGVIVNFYEKDPDRPETSSCRDMLGMKKKALLWFAKQTAAV